MKTIAARIAIVIIWIAGLIAIYSIYLAMGKPQDGFIAITFLNMLAWTILGIANISWIEDNLND